jgi:hypothetical protein
MYMRCGQVLSFHVTHDEPMLELQKLFELENPWLPFRKSARFVMSQPWWQVVERFDLKAIHENETCRDKLPCSHQFLDKSFDTRAIPQTRQNTIRECVPPGAVEASRLKYVQWDRKSIVLRSRRQFPDFHGAADVQAIDPPRQDHFAS